MAIGNTDPRRPISSDCVGQWQRMFTPGQVDEIMTIAGDLNREMMACNEIKLTNT
jgi:hypothetical protein